MLVSTVLHVSPVYVKTDNITFLNTFVSSVTTVLPVFSGLCDQRTPAVSGQCNDVRGDFLYKLPRDQRTPANADTHLVVIFAPQPADRALFIVFFITLGCNVIKFLC